MSGVLLLLVLLGSLGVPIWSPVTKDLSSPFPCQHHSCGCHDAQSCWKSCCCFSHEQKVAWAAKHNVAVPEYARDHSQQVAEESAVTKSPGKKCCHQGKDCAKHEANQIARAPNSAKPTLVRIEDAHRCQTGEALVVMLGQALPSQVAVAGVTFTLIGDFVPPTILVPDCMAQCPAAPPPRA
jgi:hypothetical protein